MHKAAIFNKKVFIILLIVLAISMSITGAGGSKADNEGNASSQPISQSKLPIEEEVIERAEKIIAELETTMPVVNKAPLMIWSDKDKQSFQDGYYTEVPNDAIMEEVFHRFGFEASTSREADIIRKQLKRLPGFVYDNSTGRYVNDETGIWYIIKNGQRVLPAEEYYDTKRIVVLPQYIKIEPRPVEAFKLLRYEKVKVESGDTFNGIVARFYPLQPRLDTEYFKNEIMRLNGIKDRNYIKAGDILTIPIYKDIEEYSVEKQQNSALKFDLTEPEIVSIMYETAAIKHKSRTCKDEEEQSSVLTPENINLLINKLNASDFKIKDTLLDMLNRWKANDFTRIYYDYAYLQGYLLNIDNQSRQDCEQIISHIYQFLGVNGDMSYNDFKDFIQNKKDTISPIVSYTDEIDEILWILHDYENSNYDEKYRDPSQSPLMDIVMDLEQRLSDLTDLSMIKLKEGL